ncbi:MAG: hypothetical protein BHV90_20735 [Clostridiales bacterium 42_27]|nr:MAG: hypothetical protein BHV90_20735 [Clostridiales bacterium 42_27]
MKITEEMLYKCAPKAEKLWLSSLPPDNQIPEHKFSRRFERKMRRLIREQRRSLPMRKALQIARQTAAAILIAATLSFSCLMTVEAYRAKFIEVITEVLYDLTHFSFFSSWQDDTELAESETLSEPQSQTIYFENSEGRQLKFSQQLVTDSTGLDIILDTEDSTTTTVPFGDYNASLIIKEDSSILMWEDDPYLMLLTGDFPSEEIIKIANGITISK